MNDESTLKESDSWLISDDINVLGFKEKIDTIINNINPTDLKSKSTRGFNAKQFMLFEEKEKFSDIIEKVKNKVILCIKEKKSINVDLKLLSAWTVLGEENSYHRLHCHNYLHLKKIINYHISTVTYLTIPDKNLHQSGNFYFLFNEKNYCKEYEIFPKEGTLIIMPIWLLHGSYPQGKGLRQTLNLDFEIISNENIN